MENKMLTTDQQENLINHFFDHVRRDICKDDHNRDLIATFIRERTAGLAMLNLAALQWAAAELGGQLHYYQHVDVSAQLAAGAEAQRKLREAEQEKNRKDQELRAQLARQARQDAQKPGVASAFGDRAEIAREEEQARKDAETAIIQQQRYLKFRERLHEADIYFEPNHARKNDVKKRMKDAIRRDFPEYENLVVD
jgi:hypothetical protein